MKTQSTVFKFRFINRQIIIEINSKLAVINPLSSLSFAKNLDKVKNIRLGVLNVGFSSKKYFDFDKVKENSGIDIFYYIGNGPLNNKFIQYDFVKNEIKISNNPTGRFEQKYRFVINEFNLPIIEVEIGGKKRTAMLDINGQHSYVRQGLLSLKSKSVGIVEDYFVESDKFTIELYNLKFKLGNNKELITTFAKANSELESYLESNHCDVVLGLNALLMVEKSGFAFNFKKKEFLI